MRKAMSETIPAVQAPANTAYYSRPFNAFGEWHDWLAVLFATVTAWIVGQFALTSSFPAILADQNPEAAEAMGRMMYEEMQANPSALLLQILGLVLGLLGMIIGTVAGLVHYLGQRDGGSKVTMVIGSLLSFVGVGMLLGSSSGSEANAVLMTVIGLSPFAYLLMLLTFPAALAGLYFGWKLVFSRTLTALHTAFARYSWGRTLQSFAIGWAVLGGFTFLMTQLGLADPNLVFDPARFVPFAVISLLFLPVQSATEEIVVRGFMNRGLIRFLGNKWVAFTITSGLFMALHLANPEARAGAEAGILPLVMSGYFFFGFAACLMVMIDDGLESAIGVHAANNTFAAIFVNYEGSVLPTPSVWQVTPEAGSDALSTILVLAVILGLLWVTRKPWRLRRQPPPAVAPADTFA